MIHRLDLRILTLAFLVAVSHIALVSHVTAHFEPALEQCELCVAQAQPLPAIPTAESGAELTPASIAPRPDTSAPAAVRGPISPYRQRAPPLTSP
jgi:hypothetical protein